MKAAAGGRPRMNDATNRPVPGGRDSGAVRYDGDHGQARLAVRAWGRSEGGGIMDTRDKVAVETNELPHPHRRGLSAALVLGALAMAAAVYKTLKIARRPPPADRAEEPSER